MCEGVVMYMYMWNRVVMPRALRREVLEGLHSAHQGVVGMKARAAQTIFWPGIDSAVQDVRGSSEWPTTDVSVSTSLHRLF